MYLSRKIISRATKAKKYEYDENMTRNSHRARFDINVVSVDVNRIQHRRLKQILFPRKCLFWPRIELASIRAKKLLFTCSY